VTSSHWTAILSPVVKSISFLHETMRIRKGRITGRERVSFIRLFWIKVNVYHLSINASRNIFELPTMDNSLGDPASIGDQMIKAL
jgi:hypothetical protein